MSPARIVVPPMRTTRRSGSHTTSAAPVTAGVPVPRAATAAWDVGPPWLVSTPRAAITPARSSGVVSRLTSTTASPRSAAAIAVSASSTTAPLAAPGDAAPPTTSGTVNVPGAIRAWSISSRPSGSIRSTASSAEIIPASAISTAIVTAARELRSPGRASSTQSLPRSHTKSMRIMSRSAPSRSHEISMSSR